jgi:hypothetical protein
MTFGKLIDDLDRLKKYKEIYYPEDNIINAACNVLEQFPVNKDVYEWIKENHK